MSTDNEDIKVFIRIRPNPVNERERKSPVKCVESDNNTIKIQPGNNTFTYDKVLNESTTQEEVFTHIGKTITENCMSGYNSTIFAYGQTGSGKTYTIQGITSQKYGYDDPDRGLAPRILQNLFNLIQREEDCSSGSTKFAVKCSLLEIYNEHITDLFMPNSPPLCLREDSTKGVIVEGAKEISISSAEDALKLFESASRYRHTMTENHKVRGLQTITKVQYSRLNLVDLAGSERQKSTNATGQQLKEASMINKSLTTLGLVIRALVDVAKGKQHVHVHYRDSKLTYLLKDSLGGNSKTSIIATVSPFDVNYQETLSTLNFAQRAKLIKNRAVINEDIKGSLSSLQLEIQRLRKELSHAKALLQGRNQSSKSNILCTPSQGLEDNFFMTPKTNRSPGNILYNNNLNDRIEKLEKLLHLSIEREIRQEEIIKKWTLDKDVEVDNKNNQAKVTLIFSPFTHQRKISFEEVFKKSIFDSSITVTQKNNNEKELVLVSFDLNQSNYQEFMTSLEKNSYFSNDLEKVIVQFDRNSKSLSLSFTSQEFQSNSRLLENFYLNHIKKSEEELNQMRELRNQLTNEIKSLINHKHQLSRRESIFESDVPMTPSTSRFLLNRLVDNEEDEDDDFKSIQMSPSAKSMVSIKWKSNQLQSRNLQDLELKNQSNQLLSDQKIEILERNLSSCQSLLVTYEEKISDLENIVEGFKDREYQMNKEIEEVHNGEINQLKEDLEICNQQVAYSQQQLDEKNRKIFDYVEKESDYWHQIELHQRNLEVAQQTIQNQKALLESQEKEFQSKILTENNDLRDEMTKKNEELGDLHKQNNKLTDEIINQKVIIDEKENQINYLSPLVEKLQEDIQSLRELLHKKDESISQLTSENQKLQEEVQSLVEDKEYKTNECMELRTEILQLKEETKENEELHQREIADFHDQIMKQRTQFLLQIDELKSSTENQANTLNEQLSEKDNQITGLNDEISKMKNEFNSEIRNFNSMINSLKDIHSKLVSKFQGEREELTKQIEKFKDETNRLEKEKLENIHASTSAEEQLKSIITSQNKEIAQSNSAIQRLTESCSKLQTDLEDQRNEQFLQSQLLSDVNSQRDQLLEKSSQLEKQIQLKDQKLQEAIKNYKNLKDQQAEIAKEFEKALQQVVDSDKLKEEKIAGLLQELETAENEANEQINDLRNQIAEIDAENFLLKEKLDEQSSQLDLMDDQLAKLQADEQAAYDEKERAVNELQIATQKYNKLHKQSVFLQSQVDNLTNENASLTGHQNQKQKIKYLANLKHEMNGLKLENMQLRDEVKALKAKNPVKSKIQSK